MELKDLIKKYHAIKPSQAWVEHNRAKILASYREAFPIQHRDLFFYFRPAFAAIIALFMFVTASSGLIVYAQKTSPGNQFYGLKRLYEKAAMVLTPASQKPVLRAEMVARRLSDVRYILDSEKENVSSLSLQVATQDLEKEIVALKKELNGDKEIAVAQGPDSPVMDNQKIIKVINNKDINLEKILTNTTEAIKNKDLEMAVAQLGDLEKIFSVTVDEKNQNEQTEEVVNPDDQKNNDTSTTLENQTTPILIPVIKKVVPDFKVDVNVEQETESSTK